MISHFIKNDQNIENLPRNCKKKMRSGMKTSSKIGILLALANYRMTEKERMTENDKKNEILGHAFNQFILFRSFGSGLD